MCNFEQCPACEAAQTPEQCALGQLGNLIHMRCRYCGAQWSAYAEPETEYETGQALDEYA